MTGSVDDSGRALCRVTVTHPDGNATETCDAWIDTGFTGSILLTQAQVAALGLPRTAGVLGSLADGSQTLFETYSCQIEWFGRTLSIEALAGSGEFPLLGVGLLEDLTLTIDYPARTVLLNPHAGLFP
jgi:clan AA aspartic protease